MKETRVPPAQSANLAANSGNTIYGVGVINNKPALAQMMAWHGIAIIWTNGGIVNWCMYSSLGLNELRI